MTPKKPLPDDDRVILMPGRRFEGSKASHVPEIVTKQKTAPAAPQGPGSAARVIMSQSAVRSFAVYATASCVMWTGLQSVIIRKDGEGRIWRTHERDAARYYFGDILDIAKIDDPDSRRK